MCIMFSSLFNNCYIFCMLRSSYMIDLFSHPLILMVCPLTPAVCSASAVFLDSPSLPPSNCGYVCVCLSYLVLSFLLHLFLNLNFLCTVKYHHFQCIKKLQLLLLLPFDLETSKTCKNTQKK